MPSEPLPPEEQTAHDSLKRKYPGLSSVIESGHVTSLVFPPGEIGAFPSEIFAFSALRGVDLAGNNMTALPDAICNLSTLNT